MQLEVAKENVKWDLGKRLVKYLDNGRYKLMKNKKMSSLLIIVLLISTVSIIMAGTIQQFTFILIGVAIMFIGSYLKPSFLVKNIEIITITIFYIGSIKGYFNRIMEDVPYLIKWKVSPIRLSTFLLLLVPLGAIWIYKFCKQWEIEEWINKCLIIYSYLILGIFIILRTNSIKIWIESFSASTKNTYIYDTLKEIHAHFRVWGKSDFYSEILAYLPEATNTAALTYYISKYGIVTGLIACISVCVLVLKTYKDLRECNRNEIIIGKICIAVILVLLVANILTNFRLLPFITRGIFLPFYSQNLGDILFVYILMGMLLSVYRYNFEVDSCI